MNGKPHGFYIAGLLLIALSLLCQPSAALFAQQSAPASQSAVPPMRTSTSQDGRVNVIVVDPAVPQPDVVREVISSLQKKGIASTEPEVKPGQADLPDQSGQLLVLLALKSTESYKNIEEFMQGLAELKQVRSIRFYIRANSSGPNYVQLKAGSKVPLTEVQLVRDYLDNQQVLSVNVGDVVSLDSADSTTHPFRVTLLQVKADWSQAADAKGLETELRTALKDATLPGELVEKLPGSGPQIFFSPKIVSYYTPDHYSQMLAWMKSRELILSTVEMKDSKPAGIPRIEVSTRMDFEALGLPPIPQVVSQPFLSRRASLSWTFQFLLSDEPAAGNVAMERRVDVMEQPRGAETATVSETLFSSLVTYQLSRETVAVINAYPIPEERTYREAANRRGFEMVFVVERDPSPPANSKVEPQLCLPDRVTTIERNTNHRGLAWPEPGIGYGRGDLGMMMRPGMPSGMGRRSGGPSRSQGTVNEVPTGSPDTAKTAVEAHVNTIYKLRQVNAAAVAEVAKLLFPQADVVVVPEQTTNSVIVRGPPSVIKDIGAIIAKLDEPALKSGNQNKVTIDFWASVERDDSKADSRDALKRAYDEFERRAGSLATELRALQTEVAPADQRFQKLQKELREAVAEAFTTRQQLLQTEVVEVQRRAQRIRESIELRNRIQSKIIERRVADLLNPDLKWEGREAPTASPSTAKSPQAVTSRKSIAKPEPVQDWAKAGTDNPDAAVVWLELVSTRMSDGELLQSATYLNGTLVSPDGLIASVLSPNEEDDVLTRPSSTRVFFGGGESGTAKIVGYDSPSGLVLLESSVKNHPYLVISDSAPALNQRFTGYVRLGGAGHDADKEMSDAEVSNAPPANSQDVTLFRVNRAGGGSRAGSPLLNSVGQLQAILAHSIPGGRPSQHFGGGGSTPESKIVPGFVISRLISKYRDRPIDGRVDAQADTLRSSAAASAPLDAVVDKNLLGVWEINYTANDRDRVPPENRTRLVFHNHHMATFRGTQRIGSYVIRTWPNASPARIEMDVCEGASPAYGYYEVNVDGLRMSVSPDKQQGIVRFGTERPEFVLLSREVSAELRASMEQIPAPQSGLQSADSTSGNTATDPRAGIAGALILRNAEEYRKSLDEAAAQLVESQTKFDGRLQELRKTNAKAIEADVQKQYPLEFDELSRLRRRQQLVRDELAAQITLLEQEVSVAEASLAKSEAELSRIQNLSRKGYASGAQIDSIKLAAEQAKRRLEAAKTLLDLYLKVEPRAESTAPSKP